MLLQFIIIYQEKAPCCCACYVSRVWKAAPSRCIQLSHSVSFPAFVSWQVKVMLRICSTLARDTSESSSFLKVDPRKKQITLYDPLTCGGQNVFQKRGNQVPPKMFAFDAVFPQDASQVGVTARLGSGNIDQFRETFTVSRTCEIGGCLPECSVMSVPPLVQLLEIHQSPLEWSVLLNYWCLTLGRIAVSGFQQDISLERRKSEPVRAWLT